MSNFFKSKDIADLCKVNFCISNSFIQFNRGSCCVQIASIVNI